MSTRTTILIIAILTILATLAGLAAWPRLPERVASHWNSQDQVDGYTSRFWGVLLLPLIAIAMTTLFLVIPRIDPLKENIAAFRGTFNTFIALLVGFLVYLYLLTLAYNLGYTFNMSTAMLPALGVFIYYTGVLLGRAQRNWFIGIRTPWTLSNDKVWEDTHRLGAILFKVSGVLAILGALFRDYALWLALVPLLGSALFLIVYSYLLYRREARLAQGAASREDV
ncbi:MAG: SdpI family protein [Anaerolineales bacterium]|nr:SdpI family protein [Anaerolineales bacterium]